MIWMSFKYFRIFRKLVNLGFRLYTVQWKVDSNQFFSRCVEWGGEKGSSRLVKRTSPLSWWRNKHLRITWTGHFLLTSAYYCRSLLWNVCVNFGLIFIRYSDAILSSKSLFCTRELKETRKHVMKVTKLKIKRGNDIIDKIPH